ncbi:pickpocket protein 28-like [Ochlerotatus camptorhynchus]|uniref:pickpocket protein 28-like n=1 Tax=Ochlerotatus camptorhynchus TaxID=644619 RepID=UPI0031D4627E
MSNQSRNLLAKLWTEYSRNSSVNALRYPFDSQLPKVERWWWRSSILSFIAAYCLIIVAIYFKWMLSPVVITYTRTMHPIWSVPFPAVTICPMAKVRVEELNLSDVMIRAENGAQFEGDEYEKLYALSHVCPFLQFWFQPRKAMNKSLVQILNNISLPMEDLFVNCYWKGTHKEIPCNKLLSRTMTDSGLCFTFNEISADHLLRMENVHPDSIPINSWTKSSDWSMETGYSRNAEVDNYPYRSIGKGFPSGFAVVLKTRKIDREYMCEGPVKGFQISIHPPDEYSTMTNRFYRLPFQQALFLTVKPVLTLISRDLKKHSHSRRQCYFNDERFLRFFKVYNLNNCMLECMANLTVSDCHCDKLSNPRSPNTTLCEGMNRFCSEIAQHKLMNPHGTINGNEEEIGPCYCMPSCVSLRYDVEVSRSPFNPHQFVDANHYTRNLYKHSDDHALVAVGFKSKWLLPLKRRELMGLSDLMAQIGGLFALMMGASVISLLEIAYFCIVRPLVRLFGYPRQVQPVQPWVE